MAEGKDPKGAKGGAPSQSAASMGVGMVPGKPHPLGIFQAGWGRGKMHSCVVFGQFHVKLRQGSRMIGRVCRKEKRVFWVPVVRGNPVSSAPGQRLQLSPL